MTLGLGWFLFFLEGGGDQLKSAFSIPILIGTRLRRETQI